MFLMIYISIINNRTGTELIQCGVYMPVYPKDESRVNDFWDRFEKCVIEYLEEYQEHIADTLNITGSISLKVMIKFGDYVNIYQEDGYSKFHGGKFRIKGTNFECLKEDVKQISNSIRNKTFYDDLFNGKFNGAAFDWTCFEELVHKCKELNPEFELRALVTPLHLGFKLSSEELQKEVLGDSYEPTYNWYYDDVRGRKPLVDISAIRALINKMIEDESYNNNSIFNELGKHTLIADVIIYGNKFEVRFDTDSIDDMVDELSKIIYHEILDAKLRKA